MAELSLPACPICEEPDSLFRKQIDLKSRPYTWYECRVCGSVLLSAGDGQWVYQKMERADKAHLLKQPLTLTDLEALLPRVEEAAAEADVSAAPAGWEVPDDDLLPGVTDWGADEHVLPAAPPDQVAEEAGMPAEPSGWEAAEPDVPEAPADWEGAEEELRASLGAVQQERPQAEESTVTVNSWDMPTVRVSQDEDAVAAPLGGTPAEGAPAEEAPRSSPPKLFVWLVGLCVLSFLVLVAIVLYQILSGSGVF
jgi:hypothetical protein